MPTSLTKKPWTVMVYMAGDNNLDPEGVQDLKEMKQVGSTDKLNIVAQFDRAAGHVARRYYLRKSGIVTGDAVGSLGALVKNPAMTPRNLSTLIVNKYLASYGNADGVTLSACDLSKVGTLATAVAGLAAALKASLSESVSRQRILTVRNQVQSYEVLDTIDLVDFCSLLAKAGADMATTTACQHVIVAVKSGYVMAQGYKGADVNNSSGVAIYFPLQSISPLYAGLDFSKKTGWEAFLKAYLNIIRSR